MPSIRLATISDLNVVQALALQTFRATYEHLNTPENFKNYIESAFSTAQLTKELTNPASCFYLLQEEKKTIGYIKINEAIAQTDLQETDSLELERIYVLQQYQGKGFGKQLLQKALQVTKEKGKKSLWLGVWNQNPKAIQFYENQGFSKFGEHEFVIGDDRQIDFLMRRTLFFVDK